MRRVFGALVAAFVIVFAVGYLSNGDPITTLKYDGVEYSGSGAANYNIQATDLTPIGNAESMNFPHTESTVYELAGVDTTQVVVAYEGSNRALSLFFKAELFRHQSPESSGVDVLSLIPGLCRYWVGSGPSSCVTSPDG